jgi:hypothetical protein
VSPFVSCHSHDPDAGMPGMLGLVLDDEKTAHGGAVVPEGAMYRGGGAWKAVVLLSAWLSGKPLREL